MLHNIRAEVRKCDCMHVGACETSLLGHLRCQSMYALLYCRCHRAQVFYIVILGTGFVSTAFPIKITWLIPIIRKQTALKCSIHTLWPTSISCTFIACIFWKPTYTFTCNSTMQEKKLITCIATGSSTQFHLTNTLIWKVVFHDVTSSICKQWALSASARILNANPMRMVNKVTMKLSKCTLN